MISIDKRVLKSALSLTRNYDDLIYYKPSSNEFIVCAATNETSENIQLKVTQSDVIPSLRRLANLGFVIIDEDISSMYFKITFEAVHRFAISFDKLRGLFFSKFIYGFVSGVLTGFATQFLVSVFLN